VHKLSLGSATSDLNLPTLIEEVLHKVPCKCIGACGKLTGNDPQKGDVA